MTRHSFILFYLFNTLGTLSDKRQFPPIHIGRVLQEQKAFDPLMFYVSIFYSHIRNPPRAPPGNPFNVFPRTSPKNIS